MRPTARRRRSRSRSGSRGPEFRLGKTYRACSSPDRAFGSGPKGSRFDSCQAHQSKRGVFEIVQTKSKLARVNGIELGYQEFGTGKPLVLLHGGFGSLEMFGPNVQLLAAGHRVIGVDLQSHGRSPAADRPMEFEAMADDMAALVKSLDLERTAIMGFS